MQILRRHGDVFEHTSGGYYRAHGRADDTMNLGGIKVCTLPNDVGYMGLAKGMGS